MGHFPSAWPVLQWHPQHSDGYRQRERSSHTDATQRTGDNFVEDKHTIIMSPSLLSSSISSSSSLCDGSAGFPFYTDSSITSWWVKWMMEMIRTKTTLVLITCLVLLSLSLPWFLVLIFWWLKNLLGFFKLFISKPG